MPNRDRQLAPRPNSDYSGLGSTLVLNALRHELEGESVVAEQAPLDDLWERQDKGPRGRTYEVKLEAALAGCL